MKARRLGGTLPPIDGILQNRSSLSVQAASQKHLIDGILQNRRSLSAQVASQKHLIDGVSAKQLIGLSIQLRLTSKGQNNLIDGILQTIGLSVQLRDPSMAFYKIGLSFRPGSQSKK